MKYLYLHPDTPKLNERMTIPSMASCSLFAWCEGCGYSAKASTRDFDGTPCPDCGDDSGALLSVDDELPDHIFEQDPMPELQANDRDQPPGG